MDFGEFKSELIKSMLLVKSGIQKIVDPIAKSESVTAIQLCVLFNIYSKNITTIGEVSKNFGVNQGNASTLCKDLEKTGLITRIRNSDDERVVNVALTPKGKKVTKRLNDKINDLENQFGNVSKEQIATIINGIKEFSELLKSVEGNK